MNVKIHPKFYSPLNCGIHSLKTNFKIKRQLNYRELNIQKNKRRVQNLPFSVGARGPTLHIITELLTYKVNHKR